MYFFTAGSDQRSSTEVLQARISNCAEGYCAATSE